MLNQDGDVDWERVGDIELDHNGETKGELLTDGASAHGDGASDEEGKGKLGSNCGVIHKGDVQGSSVGSPEGSPDGSPVASLDGSLVS